MLAVLSGVGLFSALSIPRVAAARAEGGLVTTVRIAAESIRADRVLRLAILGQVFVWSIAMIVPAAILPYATKELRLSNSVANIPLAALAIGIGVGSLLAGKLSASKVEYGLLPLGAIGLTASAFFSRQSDRKSPAR